MPPPPVATANEPVTGRARGVRPTQAELGTGNADVEVPAIDEDDDRLFMLEEQVLTEGWAERDEEIDQPARFPRRLSKKVHEHIETLSKAQLVDLLDQVTARYPDAYKFLRDSQQVAQGTTPELARSALKEIERVSSEPSWREDDWVTPDYAPVKSRLAELIRRRSADEVLSIEVKLLESGLRQIEYQYDEEGETEAQLRSCMGLVFKAVSLSSLSAVDRMMWVIYAEMKDEYDICAGTESFWRREYPRSA